MNWLKKLFTEIDNETPDFSKVQAAFAVMTGLGLQVWDVVVNHIQFDMNKFGLGCGGMFAAMAALFKWKKESGLPTNPAPPDVQVNLKKE